MPLHHCRTCFIKLEECNDWEDPKKFVLVKDFPNVEHLLRVCLEKGAGDFGLDELGGHAPNICLLCLGKWEDFVQHYLLAVESDDRLQKILRKEQAPLNGGSHKTNNTDKFNHVFIETETDINICEVEKYETTSPFYQDGLSNTSPTYDRPLCEEYNSSLLEELHSDFKQEDGDQQYIKSITKISKMKRKRTTATVCKIKRKYKTRKSRNDTQTKLLDAKIDRPNEKSTYDFDENPNKKSNYHCKPCKKYFHEIHQYEGHMKRIHEGIQRPFQCDDCDKAYKSHIYLTQHIAVYHSTKSEEIPKCEECLKTFKNIASLKQHRYQQHSNSGNRHRSSKICDQCGFVAPHHYSLVLHIKKIHTEANQIKCEHCPKIFKSQYTLKYHMISSHNPTNTKPFQCTECQMTFMHRTLLNLHKRTHMKYTERIKCDFEGCDVRFLKHGDKRHHMRLVHLKVKQHVCDFCGEAFGAMQTLRHHRYIHTGERPYKCNVCGQGFRQHTAMKTHRKAHYEKGEIARPLDMIGNLSKINIQTENSLN